MSDVVDGYELLREVVGSDDTSVYIRISRGGHVVSEYSIPRRPLNVRFTPTGIVPVSDNSVTDNLPDEPFSFVGAPTPRRSINVTRFRTYALAVLERGVKTAAQAALLVFGADQLDAMNASWADAAGFAAGGFVLSVLTSLATSGFGNDGPSVTTEALAPAVTRNEAGQSVLYVALTVLVVLVIVWLVLGLR